MYIYDLEPGQASRYHYEYDEEWLLVVEGNLVLRAPDGEHTLERGDLVRFASGPDGAHKLMNRSDAPARMLMFSSSRSPAVAVYPDSDTIGVYLSDEADDAFVFERHTAVPWAHGEEHWDKADRRKPPTERGRSFILASSESLGVARQGRGTLTARQTRA
jgi:uncharacterized cupin superfamily protein